MSWSSDGSPRVRVLRGVGAPVAADLGTVRAPIARDLVVDPALVAHASEEGYRAGYDAGFTAGLHDAAAAITAREQSRAVQLAAVVDRLAAEAEVIADRHARVVVEIEEQVLGVAFEIARTLVGRELREVDGRGADALRRCLQLAPPTGPVAARLHPDDAASLGDPAAVVGNRELTVVVDSTLAPGDAIVDVGSARIDGRIEPALDRIREVLGS